MKQTKTGWTRSTLKKRPQYVSPSTERLDAALMEQAGDAFFVHDRAGAIVEVNPKGCELLGYTRDELLAKTIRDIDPDLHPPHAQDLWDKIEAGEQTTFESRLRRRDGSVISVEITLSALQLSEAQLILGIVRDLAPRQKHDQLYRQIVENMADATHLVSLDLRLLAVNQRAFEMLGYSRRELLTMGPPDFDCGLTPIEMVRVHSEVQAGRPQVIETQHRTKDGRVIPVEVALSSLSYEGEMVMLGIVRDITQRKQVEDALRESNDRNRKLLDSSPDAIVLSEPSGRFLDCNRTAVDRYGYSREEFLQMTYRDLAALDLRDKAGGHVRETLESGGTIFEWRHRRKDGSELPVEIRTAIVPVQGEQRILATIRDLTQSEAAEKALRGSERGFRALFEAAPMGIGVADLEGNILAFNDAMIMPGGYSREDIEGGYNVAALYYDGADRETALALFLSQGSLSQHETRFKRKDGTPYDVLLSLTHTTFGGLPCVQAIVEDRTEEKRAEEVQQTLEAQLRQAAKMESIGRLAGGVAHDYNNMLAVILGHAQLALEQVDPESGLHDDLQEILKAADRSAGITQQLLAFARRQVTNPKVIDLNQAVETMVSMLGRLIGEQVQLQWQPGKSIGLTRIDPTQLDQILVNLCLNARDAIVDTGHVTIETSDVNLDRRFCAEHAGFIPGDYVLLSVADNGAGMSEEAAEHLFEPFYTTKEEGKGTGLGLATVYGIVKQNSGFIDVSGGDKCGTRIRIYLPRIEGEDIAKELPPAYADAPRGKESILLVEDEPALRRLARRILSELGYQVMTASGPNEAIRMAQEHHDLALLITDIVMPEMNGWELSDRLQALRPGLKVLYMSGYSEQVVRDGTTAKKGITIMQKPFTPRDLAVAARTLLDRE
jgi:two-component system cell cycle sensor histidine kinase/response regulator CckA